jgi:hypothetical protein
MVSRIRVANPRYNKPPVQQSHCAERPNLIYTVARAMGSRRAAAGFRREQEVGNMVTRNSVPDASRAPSTWRVAGREIAGAARDRVLLVAGVGVAVVLGVGLWLPRRLGGDEAGVAMAGALSLVTVLFVGSLMIIPLLLAEEDARRLPGAPRASPAAAVAGRGLAGLALGLVGASVALLVYAGPVIQWEPAALGALLAVVFGLSLGLMVDLLVGGRGSLNLWLTVVALALLAPALLLALPGMTGMAGSLELRWVPTVALARLFAAGLGLPSGGWLEPAVVVLLPAAVALGVVGWLVRRA